MRRGKKIRADIGTPDQLTTIRPTSIKNSYDPNQHNEYYRDTTDLFC